MPPALKGSITISKRLREHPVWERSDYGYGWLDMLMRTNDQDRVVTLHGEQVPVKRGQFLCSLRKLAEGWHKSDEWLKPFLRFCTDLEMIRVESNRRYTIITILNYDTYNPLITVTEPDTETGSVTVTEPEQKGEVGKGNRKGERASAPAEQPFPELPSDETVQQYCADYRDLARGVTAGIPEVWWRGWLGNLLKRGGRAPADWKRSLKNDFTADFIARHPKALASVRLDSAEAGSGDLKNKKNGAVLGGRSPAQARFELSRELEAIQERLETAHELDQDPKPRDVQRERELKQALKNLENEKP